jgi:serine protease Do
MVKISKLLIVLLGVLFSTNALASEFTEIVTGIKQGVVGVGTYDMIRRPQNQLLGTGFAVGDGTLVMTARHVVYARNVGTESAAVQLSVFVGNGDNSVIRKAEIVYEDPYYDIAILKVDGVPLPVPDLSGEGVQEDGTDIAFTGFPVGAAYGLYKATHRGMIAATTPLARPQTRQGHLTADTIRRLKQKKMVYQLDATSFPGNSGGPVFDVKTGQVIGMISSTFIHDSKDTGLDKPSGITFAMPSAYLAEALTTYKQQSSAP